MPTKSRSTCQVIQGVSQHQVLATFVCGTTLWLTLWLLMLTYQPSTHSCSNYSKGFCFFLSGSCMAQRNYSKRFATNKYLWDWYGQLERGVAVVTSCNLDLNTINPIYKNNADPITMIFFGSHWQWVAIQMITLWHTALVALPVAQADWMARNTGVSQLHPICCDIEHWTLPLFAQQCLANSAWWLIRYRILETWKQP